MNNVGSKSPADDANALESAIGGKLAVWVGQLPEECGNELVAPNRARRCREWASTPR